MEARYRREPYASYLILDAPEASDPYAVRILAENSIPGVLPMTPRQIDDRTEYYYEVSGCQPLKKVLEKRQIRSPEIRSLLCGIRSSLESMEEYLLPAEEIIMEPELLYVTQDLSGVFLCCCPGRREDFFSGLRGLSQYFLNKIDHTEENSVETAYELFRVCSQDIFTFDEMLQVLGNVGEAPRTFTSSQVSPEAPEPESTWIPDSEEETLPDIPAPRKRRFRFFSFLHRRSRKREAPIPKQPAVPELPDTAETQTLRAERKMQVQPHQLISQNSLKYETIPLTCMPFVIGKMEGACDGLIASPVISRIHARIEQEEGGVYLTDCGSTNGTRVNDIRLEPNCPCLLRAGDEVAFADIRYIFQ